MTGAEIDADIAAVKTQLANVHGEECEVYARIVGYYRSVRNWNKGKKDEYGIRSMFDEPSAERMTSEMPQEHCIVVLCNL